jgi:hypothetical protein
MPPPLSARPRNTGTGYPKASPGAVVLALNSLVDAGEATQVADKPATYQATRTAPTDATPPA